MLVTLGNLDFDPGFTSWGLVQVRRASGLKSEMSGIGQPSGHQLPESGIQFFCYEAQSF